MKQVVKTKEPTSLTTYRASISKEDLKNLKKFETSPTQARDDLRNKLLEEQGFVCCYCMNRIEFRNSKIEHFNPRSLFRAEQLDYSNLFIACLGGEGRVKKEQHCDTKKADEILKYIDLSSSIENNIKYKKDGFIFSNNNDINNELDTALNLNCKVLKSNREEAWTQLLINLKKEGWTIPNLKLNIEKFKNKNSKNQSRPFSEMIVYLLSKNLQSKGETA